MNKLLELEKKLKEAKAMLEKQSDKADKDEDKDDDKKKDKKQIAEALDRHNEKKHGEDKDENSAFKDADLKKAAKAANIPAKKPATPPAGTSAKPMPIGEKGSIKVSHTGTDSSGDHHFDIHRNGKRIGGANTNMQSNGSIDIGSGHSRAEGHTDDQHNEESSHIENIIETHVKKHPNNYPAPVKKSIDEILDSILEKARKPAIVTTNGETKEVSPEEQIKVKDAGFAAKKAKKALESNNQKAKAESEAAARRMAYKNPMKKSEESEQINFKNNGQWSL